MAKAAIRFEDINVVTCEGCDHITPVDMKGHGYCSHYRVKMIQVIAGNKRCIWKANGKSERK